MIPFVYTVRDEGESIPHPQVYIIDGADLNFTFFRDCLSEQLINYCDSIAVSESIENI